jgi:hypothetical protein
MFDNICANCNDHTSCHMCRQGFDDLHHRHMLTTQDEYINMEPTELSYNGK